MAIVLAFHSEFVERALTPGILKSCEVLAAAGQGIERIILTIYPKHLTRICAPRTEQFLIYFFSIAAALAQPAAYKIHHALGLIRVSPRPGDRKDTAPRHAANQDRAFFNIRSLPQFINNRADIVQRAISAS